MMEQLPDGAKIGRVTGNHQKRFENKAPEMLVAPATGPHSYSTAGRPLRAGLRKSQVGGAGSRPSLRP
jgi:hypothetical protein